MTNNELCKLISCGGGVISFIAMVGIFFGASWWLGAVIGILMILLGLFEYEE